MDENLTPREVVDCIMPPMIAAELAPTDALREVSVAHLNAHWQQLDDAGKLEAFSSLAQTFAEQLALTVKAGLEGGTPSGVGADAYRRVMGKGGTTPVFRGPVNE